MTRKIGSDPGREDETVSATELAEMGFCEQRMLLAHRYGLRSTHQQRSRQKSGLLAHEKYLHEGLNSAASDSRCFVASCIFGPMATETNILRAYRDQVLLTRPWGHLAVKVYYCVAPSVCVLLRRSPALRGIVGRWLTRLVDGRQRSADGDRS